MSFSKDFLNSCGVRSVEENWGKLSQHLKEVQEKHIPSKLTSTRFNLPWFNAQLKKMCRKKRRLYRKARKTRNSMHFNQFKTFQNKTRDAIRKAHWSYVNGVLIEGLECGDVKPFYGYIKSKQQDNQGVSALRARGQIYSDAQTKARILSEQFMSVFTKDDPDATQVRLPGPDLPDISPLVITVHGVEKLLKDINPKKASGPDEIPTRVLHNLAVEVAPVLTEIYRQSIRTGDIPIQWTKAWITPVFKKGGRSEASNYRPVSLTSVACKLLEHIVCSHVREHADNYEILGEENHGFRAKHSTETQLIMTSHNMLKQRDQGKQLDVIILDYSKAFDTIPHKRLLHKLEHYGIKGCLLNWIEAFLVGRTQSVVVDGAHSNEEPVVSGLPQGTVLGPLMFL